MKTITQLLLKVFVKQFYILNAGFLFFGYFFFFGMVEGSRLVAYHKSLLLAVVSSPLLMAVVWLAWLLYNIKCILFSTNTIKAASNTYIYSLRALSTQKQFLLYLLISTLTYMPVLSYSCLVVAMAISKSLWGTALLVIAYQLLMPALGAFILFISINKNDQVSRIENILGRISKFFRIRLGYNGFLLGHIMDEKKIAFLMVKIFSILMLSVSFIINGDHFDEDLFSIFFLLIFVAHAILVYYCADFAETRLQFSRNLPIPWYKIATMYLFTYSIILLPEVAFMLVNNHGNLPISDVIFLYLTAVATLFLCTGYLYGSGLDMENYLFLIFITFIMIFFFQKTDFKLLIFLAILAAGIAIFKTYYYSFEKV